MNEVNGAEELDVTELNPGVPPCSHLRHEGKETNGLFLVQQIAPPCLGITWDPFGMNHNISSAGIVPESSILIHKRMWACTICTFQSSAPP